MYFVKYHVSEDKSNILESSGGVQTLRNVSAYHEPGILMLNLSMVKDIRANVQKGTGHGHFLEVKNSAYHCPMISLITK